MTALVVVEAVVILLLGLLVAGLLRSHAEILRKLHDLGVHLDDDEEAPRVPDLAYAESVTPPRERVTPAFDVSGLTHRNDAVGISVRGQDRSTLLAFLSSGCKTCKGFWESFATDEALGSIGSTRVVIVTKDDAEESPTKIANLAPAGVTLVKSSQAWLDYEVPGSPYFVLVDGRSGTIGGEGSAGTWDQLENLLTEATADDGDARRRRKWQADATREAQADRELMAAGIHPGHPSLYPEPEAKSETP
jgi:hypothetical protein